MIIKSHLTVLDCWDLPSLEFNQHQGSPLSSRFCLAPSAPTSYNRVHWDQGPVLSLHPCSLGHILPAARDAQGRGQAPGRTGGAWGFSGKQTGRRSGGSLRGFGRAWSEQVGVLRRERSGCATTRRPTGKALGLTEPGLRRWSPDSPERAKPRGISRDLGS